MEELGQQQGLVLPDDPHYLTAELRSVAVSWLIEVSGEFHLQQSTLFLAVLLLDRFLQRSEVCDGADADGGTEAACACDDVVHMYESCQQQQRCFTTTSVHLARSSSPSTPHHHSLSLVTMRNS